jgi:7,8-dihydroneopterin aldolase/epimerase/oxygenase
MKSSSIKLKKCVFFAHHGVGLDEQKTGNKYTVSVKVAFNVIQAGQTDSLDHTLDYGQLYKEVEKVIMGPSAKLLEYLAYNIASNIKALSSHIQKVKVKVAKANPPIGGVCQESEVVVNI